MKKSLWVLPAVILACAMFARAAEPLPTMEELRAKFNEGKYTELIPQIARVLNLKGELAKPYDHYELLMLRGEAQIHTKASAAAKIAFADAAKAATDNDRIAVAKANAYLLGKVTVVKDAVCYIPRTGDFKAKGPIAIAERDSRKEAFQALLADELGKITAQVDAAKKNKSVPALVNVAPEVMDLSSVEIAGTGADTQTKGMVNDILDQIQKGLSDPLDRISSRVQEIERLSHEMIDSDNEGSTSRGISGSERNELQRYMRDCKSAFQMMEGLKKKLGDLPMLKSLMNKCNEVYTNANRMLNSDIQTAPIRRR